MKIFRPRLFLSLIRVLFPRWNFFDQIAHSFELSFKFPGSPAWERIPFDQKRTALGFWANPAGNYAHARMNLLEHFAGEIEGLTAFRMMRSLIRGELAERGIADGKFQFRVTAHSPEGEVVVYVSDWVDAGEP